MEPQACRLITSDSRKMCRRCFTVFESCTKLLNSIRLDVAKAVKIFQQNGSLISTGKAEGEAITCSLDYASAPTPKRLALATNSASPDVVVNFPNI